MIISHRHKFIFLKTRKTGGSSVELALRTLCGPDDIVAPIDIEEETEVRAETQHYLYEPRMLTRDWLYWLRKRVGDNTAKKNYYNHIQGWRVRSRVGEQVWNDYFKFSFERNPWDREVSLYFFQRVREGSPQNFADHLDTLPRQRMHNWEIYSQKGMPAVDFIGRYERLEADLTTALQKCGIDWTGKLTHAKSQYRTDKRNYRDFYDDRSRELIAETYRREIEYFGYEF